MSETTEIILFIIGGAFVCISGGTIAYISLAQRVARLEATIEMLVNGMGETAAKLLHSPTDHHGIDELLEKYLAHDYDLTHEEWQQLKNISEQILNDNSVSKDERLYAGFVKLAAALATHKIMRKHI